jgi:Sigma-70 region 2
MHLFPIPHTAIPSPVVGVGLLEICPYPDQVPSDPADYERYASAAPKLSDGEAAVRVALAQQGQAQARADLLDSHRRIVVRLAKQYPPTDLSFSERLQLGEQGLEMAIQRFNGTKGFAFSTYATWWVRQSITKGLGGGEGEGETGVHEPRTPGPSSGSQATFL